MRAGLWPRSSRYECSRSSIFVIWLKISTCTAATMQGGRLHSNCQLDPEPGRMCAVPSMQFAQLVDRRMQLAASAPPHLVAAGVQAGEQAVQQRHLAALPDELLRRRVLQVVLVELRSDQVRVVGDLQGVQVYVLSCGSAGTYTASAFAPEVESRLHN
jgi:hypothetical protein